jgi:rhodanese-related sulfurtransferase
MAGPARFQRVSVDFARDLIASGTPLVLDVRDPASFARGHIEGAQQANQANIRQFLSETPKDKPVLIYCYHGNSSQVFAKAFADSGFGESYSLDGGYEDWAKAAAVWQAQTPVAEPAEPLTGVAATLPLSEELQTFLVAQGFPRDGINAANATHMTPLMFAAHLGPATLVAELLKGGARVDATNLDGNQALWLACVSDDPQIVASVIEAGADLEHKNVNGSTALMYAASAGKAKALAQLLAAGADLDYEIDGISALDMASTLEGLNLMRDEKKRRRAKAAS